MLSETVKKMKEQYLPGARIMLDLMGKDPRPIPAGTKGTVKHVDDMGTVHCRFDNGRHLGLIPDVDTFHILPVLVLKPMTGAERLYCYTQSQQLIAQTGCIGHLRAEMGIDGNIFYSSWDDHRCDLKTQEFNDEFDAIIRDLREEEAYESLLKNRSALAAYCGKRPGARLAAAEEDYGFRIDTEKYTYMLRLNPQRGYHNLYCYCYLREWLDRHMKNAEKGIRFIDSHYNEKFRVTDGEKVRWILSGGENRDAFVRYIDDYHFETNAEWGGQIWHICEFAEKFEQRGCKSIFPLRDSLTAEQLKDIYRCLYNENQEAADDEYLEYFEENYTPDNLDTCKTAEDVKKQIVRLIGEILDDTGSEEITRKWLIDAGADTALVAACGL